MTIDQPHELTWGALVLSSDASLDTPYQFETLVGTAFGNPVTLVEAVRSYIEDGELHVRTGWGNREEAPVLVRVSAPDGQALAQGEAALATEFMAEQPSPLVWTPPTAGAWPMVLEVVTVAAERDWPVEQGSSWDHRERETATRVYRLEFNLRPFTRDLDTTVIPALPVPEDPDEPPEIVQIDTCDSTSGWDQKTSPTSGVWSSVVAGPTLDSGALKVQGVKAGGSSAGWLSLERTGAVSMSGMEYLYVDVKYTPNGLPSSEESEVSLRFDLQDDLIVYPIAVAPTDLPDVRRYYFSLPITSFNKVLVRLYVKMGNIGATTVALRVYEVGRTDRLGIDGTSGFQVARTATIEGSAPTAAAVRLDSGAAPLIGSTAMIYTGTSPVVPLRALVSNAEELGDLNVDPLKMSGATNDLSAPMEFLIPVTRLADATSTLLARLNFTGTATIDWSARTVAEDGTDIPGSDLVISGTILLRNDTVDPWRIHALAATHLPVIAFEGETTDMVELTLSMATGGAGVLIDEGWIVDTDNGAVTLVHEPSAFQLTSIELRSAQLGAPRPSVYGTWSGGRIQDITRLARLGTHRFEPGLIHIFTATDLAKYAPCELEYYRRYFLHPGPALPSTDTEG